MLLAETLETPRLHLRKPRLEDAAGVYESYGRDAEVTRFLTWRPHTGMEDALAAMLARLACWEAGTEFSWVIAPLHNPGAVLGMISGSPEKQPWRWTLGYVLAGAQRGRGLMPEAVVAVAAHLLAQPGIQRVGAVVDEENYASARVLEKAGFEREGILRRWSLHPNISPVPRDCWSFALVK